MLNSITVTRWLDKERKSLDEVEPLLLGDHPDENSQSSISYVNWKVENSFNENKKTTLNGKPIEYNYYTYSYDQIPAGMQDDEDATVNKTGFIIPYISGGKIRYIINHNTGSLTILRKLLKCSKRQEIVANNLPFNQDLFFWLINKVYHCENVIDSESESLSDLTIDSIRGFKGDTDDLLTTVSAVGDSVMNIISTLSFLLESQTLNKIMLDIKYCKHENIEIDLSTNNKFTINNDRYVGELIQNINSPEAESTIILLLYSEILPIIIQSYQSELAGNQWGQEKNIGFLESVANSLSEKVAKRVEDLKSRPIQTKLNMNGKTTK